MNARPTMTPFHLGSFLGGQSDYEDKGIAGAFKSGMNLDVRKQKDTLSCQFALKDDLALGSLPGPAYFTVAASDGQFYVFCYSGDIYRRKANGSWLVGSGLGPVFIDTFESGHIIGAAEWYDSAGFTYLVWATPTRVNIKKILGPGYTPVEPWPDVNVASTGTWPKTNLTSADFHTMAIANGVLQICNGNVMALIGYDLSYTNNSLALIPGNAARLVLERGKYGVIGCRSTNGQDQSMLFDWDGIGLSWNDKQIIKFGGINSMIDTEIAIAQLGTNGQLYISDFTTPIPFRQIRGGGQSDPDGICAYHGMALIGIYGNTNAMDGKLANGIYSIGRINKNAPVVLNLDYQLTCDEIYSVKTVGTDIFCVYKYNGQYGVKMVDTGTYARAVYQSLNLVAPVGKGSFSIPLGRLLQWARIDIEASPLPPGTKIEVWYRIDNRTEGGPNNDGWIQANTDPANTGGGTQFQGSHNQNAVFLVGEKARVFEVQLILIPSGNRTPEVDEINTYFTSQ